MPGFKKGELIMQSVPYAFVLNTSEKGKRCNYCFELNKSLKRCSQCKFSYFCDKECQTKAWEYHKDECKCIKKVFPNEPGTSLLLFAQILHKIKRFGWNEPTELTGKHKRAFRDLESHAKEISSNPSVLEKVSFYLEGLKDFMSPEDIPEFSDLTEVYGRMVVNTFSISNAENQSIGAGFYLGASIFDHSCEPNAEVVFEGTSICIRAVQDLPDDDLRKVYISYIDSAQVTKERQSCLEEQYYFKCQCTRCTDQRIDELMTKSLADPSVVKEVTEKSKSNLEKIKELKKKEKNPKKIYDIAMDDLSAQESVLGKTHINRIKMLEHVFDACITLGSWSEALAVGYELVEPYRLYYSEYHPDYCILLIKLGKILLLLHENDKALKELIKAEESTKVSHGIIHPLYREAKKLLLQCQQEMIVQ